MILPPCASTNWRVAFDGVVAPHVVVGHQHPVVAVDLHRVLDDRLREIAAVAVPHELGAVAVLSRLGRRTRVRVQVDDTVLLRHLRDRVGNTRMQRADQKRHVVARDHALGDARAGRRRGLGINVDCLDRPAEHAAFVVEFLDREHCAEPLVAAAGSVLTAGVHRQAKHQWFFLCGLRPCVVMLPWSVERRDAVQAGRRRTECARFQQATTGRGAGRCAGRCRLRGLGLLLLLGRSFHCRLLCVLCVVRSRPDVVVLNAERS